MGNQQYKLVYDAVQEKERFNYKDIPNSYLERHDYLKFKKISWGGGGGLNRK